jgi:chromosome segregation ATPase
LKAKDIQINDLKIIEGELKGKEKMIAALNRDVERLQQQLDSLSHRKDSHFGSLKEMEMLVKEKEDTIIKLKDKFEQI